LIAGRLSLGGKAQFAFDLAAVDVAHGATAGYPSYFPIGRIISSDFSGNNVHGTMRREGERKCPQLI
jgi:hypothetical protein